jgi:hypothetical protein
MATLCLIGVALQIIVLFVSPLFDLALAGLVALLFAASVVALIGSLLAFLRDVLLSLTALELEIHERPSMVPSERPPVAAGAR